MFAHVSAKNWMFFSYSSVMINILRKLRQFLRIFNFAKLIPGERCSRAGRNAGGHGALLGPGQVVDPVGAVAEDHRQPNDVNHIFATIFATFSRQKTKTIDKSEPGRGTVTRRAQLRKELPLETLIMCLQHEAPKC
jgi:hypothetical protein